MRLMKDNNAYRTPQPCLRQKYDLSKYRSELELFEALEMKDTWPDAKLRECFMYLYSNKKMTVPTSWRNTMRAFAAELQAVTWLICVVVYVSFALGH